MNKFIGIGRLVREPELKKVGAKNSSLANFSVAINRAYDKTKTDFINCSAWGKTGEYLAKYGKKGQLVSFEGELQINQTQDKRIFPQVNVSSANILTTKQEMSSASVSVSTGSDDFDDSSNLDDVNFDDFEADLAPKKEVEENPFGISEDDMPF